MDTPLQVVEAQFAAYNANDAQALAAIYAEDARLFQHPDTLMVAGRPQIEARFRERFALSRPQARLLNRIAAGDLVIDHEIVTSSVTSSGAPGAARMEMAAIYQVRDGRIAQAWFSMASMASLRLAREDDIPAMEALIARSGIELSQGFYTPEQAEAVTRHVFGVDTQLVADQTYYVIEQDGKLAACGGWSKRATLFGADKHKQGSDPLLDPATEPGRIRAFFVAPDAARRGLGRMLLEHCTAQALQAGFGALELAGTLPGVPLYLASGFEIVERFEVSLPGGVQVPLARMRKDLRAG
ncbi:GNAT family N-acetyltransferase [Oxalobacteraceae bacterium A2-2]